MTIAQKNLDITLEKFNIGTIDLIEYRKAQRNHSEAAARYDDSH